jgi:hypothetical protein
MQPRHLFRYLEKSARRLIDQKKDPDVDLQQKQIHAACQTSKIADRGASLPLHDGTVELLATMHGLCKGTAT